MIVFKDTGEVCVLVERFNSVERREKGKNKSKSWANWCWDAHWNKDWGEAGPWQRFLSCEPEYVREYGISSMNLFNRLSHRGAVKKDNIIKVLKTP